MFFVVIENADATPPHLDVLLRLGGSLAVHGSLQFFAFGFGLLRYQEGGDQFLRLGNSGDMFGFCSSSVPGSPEIAILGYIVCHFGSFVGHFRSSKPCKGSLHYYLARPATSVEVRRI